MVVVLAAALAAAPVPVFREIAYCLEMYASLHAVSVLRSARSELALHGEIEGRTAPRAEGPYTLAEPERHLQGLHLGTDHWQTFSGDVGPPVHR